MLFMKWGNNQEKKGCYTKIDGKCVYMYLMFVDLKKKKKSVHYCSFHIKILNMVKTIKFIEPFQFLS